MNKLITKQVLTYFVFLIPILSALVVNTTGYFPGKTLNPGTVRGFLMVPFIFIFLMKYWPGDSLSRIILGYVLYYFVLCLFSSSYSDSFYSYFKFLIAILMFPVGYVFINNYNKFQKLNKFFFIALCIYLLNLIISNLFNLGTSDYLEDSIYFGAGRVNMTKAMIVIAFASTNLFSILNRKQRKYFIAIIMVAAFFGIVGIKRSVLLSLGIGFLFYLKYNKLKQGAVKIVLPIIIGLFTVFFIYPEAFNMLQERFEAREDRIGFNQDVIDSEARVNETSLVVNAWVDGGIIHKLFGSELFNDREFFHSKRMLHTDYMVILNGSGIFGLFLWFAILLNIFKAGQKYFKYFDKDIRFPFLKPTFYALLISQLFMSISGTIQAIDIRTCIFLYLGAILGTMRGEYIRTRYLKKKSAMNKLEEEEHQVSFSM